MGIKMTNNIQEIKSLQETLKIKQTLIAFIEECKVMIERTSTDKDSKYHEKWKGMLEGAILFGFYLNKEQNREYETLRGVYTWEGEHMMRNAMMMMIENSNAEHAKLFPESTN